MLAKKIILLIIIVGISLITSGCNFMVPQDDLNGNNDRIKAKEEVQLNKDSFRESQKTGDKNEMIQLRQSVNQAAYDLKENQEAVKENEPVVTTNTDLENELVGYANKYTLATIKTNLGKIKVSFYNDQTPLAVGNFIKLAESNFYDETKFHRVISGFMIQGGDPNSRDDDWEDDGLGGAGYNFRDEVNSEKLVRGSLAMANSGKDTNSSQFFIVTAETVAHLDGKHTNFGKVIEGMETVDKIEKVRINEKNHPTSDVIIESIELEN